jgi:hypothetical protein
MSRAPIPLTAAVGDPGSDPLIAVWVSASWLKYVIGACLPMTQPWYFSCATAGVVDTTNQQAQCVINNLGQAGLGTQRGPRPIVNGGPLSPLLTNGIPGILILND